jgi:hypothetical protein
MDDQLNEWGKVKWGLFAAFVVAELAGVVAAATHGGLWMAVRLAGAILAVFLLLFGAYYFWRRTRARQRRRLFSAAIQAQATVAPRSVSDPNERAALDRLRQKFQTGVNEFTSRGRDIYKLPWYVFIGEPGSGKTEAIRHSGIDFPPGMQNELQGSGGTVNMDWWFTNHGILLDTAGRLLFSDAPTGQTPEWTEFLRLLRKTRSHCPINGLFIVLSVESLIKDSADKIVQKASRLAQQLDRIQRALDVRFPVYLLVSKCDLLTGFRDFFESIDDPLLQHQMFGWSNPDPLDAPFRPDLVEAHLNQVVERLRRRRLALLRDSFARRLDRSGTAFRSPYQVEGSESAHRRAEEAESLFALPESIVRLAPRLRRYLESIFVAGEWSAKPVFLRGIYFTSSMREGKALDEAIAFATGVPLEQLPEDQSWDKDRAFFLRDMFLQKVFQESGLVTRATKPSRLLRTRLLTLYGTSAAALLLFLGLAAFGYESLNASARREADYWKYARDHWNAWSPGIVSGPNELWQFVYSGNQTVDCRVPFFEHKPTLVEYHRFLEQQAERPLSTGWVFKPISWFGRRGKQDRPAAQRVLFKEWVLKPLVSQTRLKMARPESLPSEPGAMGHYRDAWVALVRLEADAGSARPALLSDTNAPERYLRDFLSYLVGSDFRPDPNLVDVLARTYGSDRTCKWPPEDLLFGDTLSQNTALATGLSTFYAATRQIQTNLFRQVAVLDGLVDGLNGYQEQEQLWLHSRSGPCQALHQTLLPLKTQVTARSEQLRLFPNSLAGPLTNLHAHYTALQTASSNASVLTLLAPVNRILVETNRDTRQTLFREIRALLERWGSPGTGWVRDSYATRQPTIAVLERDQLPLVGTLPAYEARWQIYTQACELESISIQVGVGDQAQQSPRSGEWAGQAARFRTNLLGYHGPLAEEVVDACSRIIPATRGNSHQAVEEDSQAGRAILSGTGLPRKDDWPRN